MSRLINAEHCVEMAVRSFLPYVRLINEGQYVGEWAALQRSALSRCFSKLSLPPLIMRQVHTKTVHIYLDIQTISVTPTLTIGTRMSWLNNLLWWHRQPSELLRYVGAEQDRTLSWSQLACLGFCSWGTAIEKTIHWPQELFTPWSYWYCNFNFKDWYKR